MADFQEVIEQFKRLCDSVNQDCASCGLGNMSCSMKDIVDNSVEFEKRVMSWAEEHPIIYPTWGEFLYNLYPMMGPSTITDILEFHVPPALAEKLGIEPKEV